MDIEMCQWPHDSDVVPTHIFTAIKCRRVAVVAVAPRTWVCENDGPEIIHFLLRISPRLYDAAA